MKKQLPKTTKPLFEIVVPSTKKPLMWRPFVSREEKILLTAQESGTDKEIILAIKQVIQNCAADESFDVDSLTTFDLEYIFVKLRARSVNNIVEVTYRDGEDEKLYPFEVDLNDVEIIYGSADPVIQMSGGVGCKMKYPSITIVDDAPTEAKPDEVIEYMIHSCIDTIFDSEDVYPASDYTKEELSEWLDDLASEDLDKIRNFFNEMPKMYYEIKYTNSKGTVQTIELNTLTDFFTWR